MSSGCFYALSLNQTEVIRAERSPAGVTEKQTNKKTDEHSRSGTDMCTNYESFAIKLFISVNLCYKINNYCI